LRFEKFSSPWWVMNLSPPSVNLDMSSI
jgi:hypothetical protein